MVCRHFKCVFLGFYFLTLERVFAPDLIYLYQYNIVHVQYLLYSYFHAYYTFIYIYTYSYCQCI